MTGHTEKTAWVVSAGQYSDYRVLCVCDSKQRAEEVAKALRGDEGGWHHDADVEGLPYVDSAPVKVPILNFTVTVWDDGHTSDEREWETSEWPFDQYHPLAPVAWRWVRAPVHEGKGGRLDIRGTDLERVRRVFSDRRAQLLAEDAFRMKQERSGRA